MHPRHDLSYRREIDGLRALAVLPVIFYHAGLPGMSGGFIGVDVFFVISGFLITSILLREIGAGRFSLLRFYERRARRILPALTVVTLATVPFAWAWMQPSEFKDYGQALVGVAAFASNIVFWKQSNYFSNAAEENPLMHTWSLGVEEQYYILFPLFLMLFFARWPRLTLVLLGLGVLISLGLAEWAMRNSNEQAAFFLLPTRLWELGLGAMAAFWGARGYSIKGDFLSGLAFLALVASFLFFTEATPIPSAWGLIPVGATALILLFGVQGTAVAQILSLKPLVGIGLISYSAYLWHHPLFAFARLRGVEHDALWAFAGLALLSLGLAYLTWRFVETPFRKGAPLAWPQLIGASGAALTAVAGLGIGALAFPQAQNRVFEALLTPEQAQNATLMARYQKRDMDLYDDGACRFPAETFDADLETRFAKCVERHGPALVVLGDSHGINIYNAMAQKTDAPFILGAVRSACRPQDNKSECQYADFARFVERHAETIAEVIYHQSGSHLMLDPLGQPDSPLAFEDGARVTLYHEKLARLDSYLAELNVQVPVTWLGPFAEFRERSDFASLHRQRFNPNALALFDWLEPKLERKAQGYRYVALHPHLDTLYGEVILGDCLTVLDQDHWSSCGEPLLGEKLAALDLVPDTGPPARAVGPQVARGARGPFDLN